MKRFKLILLFFFFTFAFTGCMTFNFDNPIDAQNQLSGPCPGTPTVSYAGKTYNTVQIGDQCWLKENLNYEVNNSWCYDNNSADCETYGRLYTWNAAMNGSTTPGTRGICPPGWHIPTRAEFETLASAVGNNGNALKAIGQGTGGGAGTNTSGFSALLAGARNSNGNFIHLGGDTYFWSSTEISSTNAYSMNLFNSNSTIYLYNYNKDYGFSVRCLQD